MNRAGCDDFQATDLVLQSSTYIENNNATCSSNFVGVAFFAGIVGMLRLGVTAMNLLVFAALVKMRRKKNMGPKGGQQGGPANPRQAGPGGESNKQRIPLTLVLETMHSISLFLFIALALTNDISSEDGSALILCGIFISTYCFAIILSIIKMVNLSRRTMNRIMRPERGRQGKGHLHGNSPSKFASSQTGTGSGSESGAGAGAGAGAGSGVGVGAGAADSSQASYSEPIDKSIRQISEFRSNRIMQLLLILAVITSAAVPGIVIVGIAMDFAPHSQWWVELVFIVSGVSGLVLNSLVIYHTLKTIQVVKSSVVYQAARDKSNVQVSGTANIAYKLERLVSRLWFRFWTNVSITAVPIVMLLQGLGYVPMRLEIVLIIPLAAIFTTLAALLIYKPQGGLGLDKCWASVCGSSSTQKVGTRDEEGTMSTTQRGANLKRKKKGDTGGGPSGEGQGEGDASITNMGSSFRPESHIVVFDDPTSDEHIMSQEME